MEGGVNCHLEEEGLGGRAQKGGEVAGKRGNDCSDPGDYRSGDCSAGRRHARDPYSSCWDKVIDGGVGWKMRAWAWLWGKKPNMGKHHQGLGDRERWSLRKTLV